MVLSICIPSYNRGHRACELVKKLLALPYGKEGIEIVCSNNGSTKNVEGYEQIRNMKEERLVYFQFESNQGYMKNINQVLRLSRGDFALIISDEDEIVRENFQYYYNYLAIHPEISVMKARTSKMYQNLEDCYVKKGEDALEAFYMHGNYVSGIIYNRNIITNEVVDKFESRYNENVAYQIYVHMFLDTYALVNGNFCSSCLCLIQEGIADENGADRVDIGETKEIFHYSSYQSRLQQMKGFVEQIRDMDLDKNVKRDMLVIVILKTVYLLELVQANYIQSHGSEYWSEIMLKVCKEMKEIIAFSEISFGIQEIQILHHFIEKNTILKQY